MEGRVRSILLSGLRTVATGWLLGLGLSAQGVHAAELDQPVDEPIVEPKLDRPVFDEAKIDTENFEFGAYGGLLSVEDFGTNTVVGARLAYHVSDTFFLEAAYGQATTQKTSYERLSGAVELLTDDERELSYYNLSVGYNVLPGEAFVSRGWAVNTDFYLIGGIGSTRFAGDDRFTINFGAGYRVILTDWLALHLDARDQMFDMDLLGETKATHNLELHGGMTLFF